MLGYVIPVVVVASAFWVYFDATANKIGRVAGVKGMFNMSAGGWAAVTLFLWIVGFPSYLIKRAALIQLAKTNPTEVKARAVGFVLVAVGGAALIALSVAMTPVPGLPECDSGGVQDLIWSIPAVKLLSDSGARLRNPAQTSYDAGAEKRTCTAVFRNGGQEVPFKYTISWQDKSSGQYWVQIVP
jgi:hypothetical protein